MRRWLVLILLVIPIAWQSWAVARRAAIAETDQRALKRLDLYSSTLANAIARYSYLPIALAVNSDVQALLAHPGDGDRALRVDRMLQTLDDSAGAASLYLLDSTGLTIAASNWNRPDTFVGNRYSFRPYFTQARERGKGSYYGVGVTTQLPGYFLSAVVPGPEGPLGVAVTKVDLEPLQREWAAGGESLAVFDRNGVVILSSFAPLKFGALGDIPKEAAALVAETREYGDEKLHPLDYREIARTEDGGSIAELNRHRYLVRALAFGDLGWQIRYLSDLAPVEERAQSFAALAGALWLAACLLFLYLRQRRLSQRLDSEARDAKAAALREANDRLEHMVQLRTADLREAQDELVRAGKLAALGHMSAGIVHEISQPLAAMTTLLSSNRILLERGERDATLENLSLMQQLIGRIGDIIRELKLFAGQQPASREPVAIAPLIRRALAMVESALPSQDAVVSIEIPEDAWTNANATRLEQVFANLFRNAFDAMQGRETRRLSVRGKRSGASWKITVADSGAGIDKENLSRLFDPFFTTKEVGKGLGLGLSISLAIIRDLGGKLSAGNAPAGGASFVLTLPAGPADATKDSDG
jgi:two-component system C4-dicarboxylate transport sensor histidine kinase DctB